MAFIFLAFIFLGLFIFGATYGWSRMSPVQRAGASVFGAVAYLFMIIEMKAMIDYSLVEIGAPDWVSWAISAFSGLMGILLILQVSLRASETIKTARTKSSEK